MKKYHAIIAFCFLTLTGHLACKKPPSKTKPEVMQERLEERLARWREGMHDNCRNKVMETASAIADSTLLSNARYTRDTSGLPPIPGRPSRPDFKPPEDTLRVKPILENRAIKDSLLREN